MRCSLGPVSKSLSRSARCFSLVGNNDNRIPPTSLVSYTPGWPRYQPWSLQQQKRAFLNFKRQTVITEYRHLPEAYKDEEGLPFQEVEALDRNETINIFPGLHMTPTRAYRLLAILHGRRVAGTLDDPNLAQNTAMYSRKEIKKALDYLRKTVPVDELLNAGLRAEDELRQMGAMPQEDETTTKTTTTVLKADIDEKAAPSKKKRKLTPEEERRALYGESILDRIRAQNTARRDAEERAEEERRRLEDEKAAQNWGGLATYDPKLHRGLRPQQLKHYEAATSPLDAPPDVPRWRVLAPMMTFLVVALGVLYFLVDQVAGPQPGGVEVLKGISVGRMTVYTIVLLNVLTFVAWKRVRLWKFLNRNFVLDFVTPRPHQLLTAMFTHLNANYLAKNMTVLLLGGSLLADEVGPVPFVATYFASSMCAMMFSMFSHVVRGIHTYTMGASSAALGVTCAYFWLYRFDGFKILGLPPDPYQGIQGLGIIGLVMSFFALIPLARGQQVASQVGHLNGMLTGIACAALMEKKWKLAKGEKMLEKEDEENAQAKKPVVTDTGEEEQKKS